MTTVLASRTGIRGRRADGQIVEGIIPQFDGIAPYTLQKANCGPASESMRDVSQQKGVRPSRGSPWPPTADAIRDSTGDTVGGTTPTQTTAATRSRYGISTANPRIASASEVKSRLWSSYAVDALVGYGPIDDYRSGSPGFRGNHRVVLIGIRTTATGALQVLVADPLYDGRRSGIPRGPQWLPWGVIYRALGALKVDGVRTLNQSHGLGKAYYIPSLTRNTPVAQTGWVARIPSGTRFWIYSVSGETITGRRSATTVGFTAQCTAPDEKYWPGHGTYTLVRITSGGHAGKWIAAKFARKA